MKVTYSPIPMDEAADETEDFGSLLDEYIGEAMTAYAEILRAKLEEITPKRTGLTAASWEVFPLAKWEFFISNANEPIATFLSEGTSGHWVEPVVAMALHWVGPDGKDYFSKGHMVTGITPLFLEETAMRETDAEADRLIEEAMDQAFEEAYTG